LGRLGESHGLDCEAETATVVVTKTGMAFFEQILQPFVGWKWTLVPVVGIKPSFHHNEYGLFRFEQLVETLSGRTSLTRILKERQRQICGQCDIWIWFRSASLIEKQTVLVNDSCR